ncbi:hypothetical protein SETIT_4G157600v2 [Setaria italica]|uniref:Myb-like domain-containing protein n=1 Tax=Setaria italica TaxID=4555 RepID=K3Y1W5_SETIT|nr:hypothetical protein SETIT_4G157600v2 [Setaria italica]
MGHRAGHPPARLEERERRREAERCLRLFSTMNFRPHHYPQNYLSPHVHPNFHDHYPQNVNPFLGPSYQSLSPTPASYHGGPFSRNIRQYLPGGVGGFVANGPASPVGSMAFLLSSGGSKEWSYASEDEAKKKGGRIIWNQEDDLRLVSCWLKNSNDPISGNGKKSCHFWKDIADEYNKHAPEGKNRTAMQCKEHWNKTIPHINKFHGVYHDICSTIVGLLFDCQWHDCAGLSSN